MRRMGTIDKLISALVESIWGEEKPAKKRKTKEKQPVEVRIQTVETAADQREGLRQTLAASPIAAIEQEPRPMKPAFEVAAWSVPKPGNPQEQNKDAFASRVKDGRLVANASDGVTEKSFDSKSWATSLCETFLDRPAGALTAAWLDSTLATVAAAFREKVGARVATADKSKPYGWMAKPRAEQGSKATLLSVEIGKMNQRGLAYWKAFAVGDTNMFVVRDGQMIRAWPLETAAQFVDESPAAMTKEDTATEWRTDGKGWVRDGDQIYLMTDALAQYALRRHEAGDPIWGSLKGLDGEAAFAAFVELARADGMRPDDTTLQRIVVSGG